MHNKNSGAHTPRMGWRVWWQCTFTLYGGPFILSLGNHFDNHRTHHWTCKRPQHTRTYLAEYRRTQSLVAHLSFIRLKKCSRTKRTTTRKPNRTREKGRLGISQGTTLFTIFKNWCPLRVYASALIHRSGLLKARNGPVSINLIKWNGFCIVLHSGQDENGQTHSISTANRTLFVSPAKKERS